MNKKFQLMKTKKKEASPTLMMRRRVMMMVTTMLPKPRESRGPRKRSRRKLSKVIFMARSKCTTRRTMLMTKRSPKPIARWRSNTIPTNLETNSPTGIRRSGSKSRKLTRPSSTQPGVESTTPPSPSTRKSPKRASSTRPSSMTSSPNVST